MLVLQPVLPQPRRNGKEEDEDREDMEDREVPDAG
jgi:hypothetical protein